VALFYYEIRPGDGAFVSAMHFFHGVVEAESQEIEAIDGDVRERHAGFLQIWPIDEATHDITTLRTELRLGLEFLHCNDGREQPICVQDRQFYPVEILDWEYARQAGEDGAGHP
jgi:hypothetical protein